MSQKKMLVPKNLGWKIPVQKDFESLNFRSKIVGPLNFVVVAVGMETYFSVQLKPKPSWTTSWGFGYFAWLILNIINLH